MAAENSGAAAENRAAPVRLAVLGAGIMGTNHARVATGVPGVEFVAVLDPDRERSEKLAAAFGATTVTHVRELPRLMVEAAVVATPTDHHAQVAHELIAAGIDVLVEKPIAPDVATAQRLVDSAEAAG